MIMRIIIENEILNTINKEDQKALCEFTNYKEFTPMPSGDLLLSFQTKDIYKRFLDEVRLCYSIVTLK